MALGVGHDRGVDEAQIEIPVPRIDLGCATHQAFGHELDDMLSRGHCGQEGRARIAAHPCSKKLVDLHDDRIQDDEFAPEPSYQSRSEIMSSVLTIRRGHDGPSVGQDLQPLETGSRR